MASSTYGRKLDPYRRLRDPLGIKGVRQSVVVTNNPSTIDQNQQLLVRFPNLGANDVIVPGTVRLAFTISLTSTDANRTLVQNLGRAIVKKTTIKISGNEVMSTCELLESHMPFYQSALGDRLEYELTFNDYSRVIQATGDASYTIDNISLEYDMVTQPEIARMIRNQYASHLAVLYERVLRHRKIVANKSDTLWNINLNVPARSMKGILMLFEDEQQAFQRHTEAFYNPKITKVEVTIEGVPNQLYSQGLRAYQLWDEAKKFLASAKEPAVGMVLKDMGLHGVNLAGYLTSKYALWLDLRTTDDNKLHGSGRRVENASEGITIQITKKAEAAGALNTYLYIIMDAQLNIENG